MKEKLVDLLKKSYSPYSKYQVSAIVETKDGHLFEGVNVENASYGSTICAEKVAITNAITKGYKKGDFKAIYIMANSEKISSCCFTCRQLFVEFFDNDIEIHNYNILGDEKIYNLSSLCPHPFSGDDLK